MKKIILITGCSKGLGEYLAEYLGTKGFRVYAGVRKVQKFKNAIPVILDVTRENEVKNALSVIIEKEGRIDVLINNAAVTKVGPFSSFNTDDFADTLEVNVLGMYRMIKGVYPHMKATGGKVINIISLNGIVAFPNFSIYSSSKFAARALGESLRYEFAKDNIQVTNVIPGAIKSEGNTPDMPHKPAREKFLIIKLLLPMIDKAEIASKVLDLLQANKMPVNVLLGRDTILLDLVQRFAPRFVWYRLMKYIWEK